MTVSAITLGNLESIPEQSSLGVKPTVKYGKQLLMPTSFVPSTAPSLIGATVIVGNKKPLQSVHQWHAGSSGISSSSSNNTEQNAPYKVRVKGRKLTNAINNLCAHSSSWEKATTVSVSGNCC